MYYFKSRFFIETRSIRWVFQKCLIAELANDPVGKKWIMDGFTIRIPNKIK